MQIDLPVVWAAIIGLGVFIYVMLDGFDLGIGLLFPFFESKADRQVMLNTVAPVWDGNETFLVLGGAALYGAFPVVYATLLPANYLPLILMLVGLIFRGAAFELRAKATRTQHAWDLAFMGGSALAAMCQGIVLGSLLQGIHIVNGRFAGEPFDWLSPFSLFCGLGVLVTYATLACGWLILKTEGELQRNIRSLMKRMISVMLGVIVVVSIWTVLGLPAVETRWFGGGDVKWFMPVPVLVVACVWGILRSLRLRHEAMPFLLTLAVCFLGYSGLLISIWPNIVPAVADDLGSLVEPREPTVRTRGHRHRAAGRARLQRDAVPGVSRQGAGRRRGLPLTTRATRSAGCGHPRFAHAAGSVPAMAAGLPPARDAIRQARRTRTPRSSTSGMSASRANRGARPRRYGSHSRSKGPGRDAARSRRRASTTHCRLRGPAPR